MEKISDDPVCFVVSLKEVNKVRTFSIGSAKEKSRSQAIVSEKKKR